MAIPGILLGNQRRQTVLVAVGNLAVASLNVEPLCGTMGYWLQGMTWKLYYDGECNLCHGSQLRVVKWAAKSGQPVETEVLQSAEAESKGYRGDAMVLEADKVYYAESAWLRLMRVAPWHLRWVGWLGFVPGVRWLLGVGYRIVARYRKKWFGTRACPLPPRT